MRFWSFLFALFLAACATPDFAAPSLDAVAVKSARDAGVREAMETALRRRARVYDLAAPVLAKNVDLCPKVRPSIGVVLADREQLARLAGGLRGEDLAEIGVPDELTLAHVFAGSPAKAAGLQSGARLLKVAGEDVADPDAAAKAIRKGTEEGGAVILTVDQGDGPTEIEVTPIDQCDYAVKISTSQAINAHAYSGDIVINTGIIRVLDDDALQFLIAHEAAHLIAEHRRKYVHNSIVSGAVVVGPVLYGAGTVADLATRFREDPPDVSFTARALRASVPWAEDFEAEADYLGLYLFARAGGELSGARQLFDVFSRETPSSLYARVTHPLTQERLVRLEAGIAEIDAKRSQGLPLEPEKVAK